MRSEVCRNQALRRIYQMNIESERAAFEAWMVEVEGVRIKPRFDRATAGPFAGDYRDGQVQGAWNVWQARAALSANHSEQFGQAAKFTIGDRVRKTKGSQWHGTVVGTYSTALTPEGYAVESSTEIGSVQIYPAAALEACE